MCLERLIVRRLLWQTQDHLDPLLFAYKHNGGTYEATVLITRDILGHLEKPNSSARILYLDFSFAFNTVRPSFVYQKLCDVSVSPQLIRWVVGFSLNRVQYVSAGDNSCNSDCVVLSTGTPQGCVLSSTLFTLYRNNCRTSRLQTKLLKFADDYARLGLILKLMMMSLSIGLKFSL